MPRQINLTGDDTITIIQGATSRTLADFANGTVSTVSKPVTNATRLVGKGGNGIVARNYEGNAADQTIRVLSNSPDDQYLSALVASYEQNPTRFVLLDCVFNKSSGDGAGNVSSKTYTLTAGYINKQADTSSNVSGDGEQAIANYVLEFIDSTVNFS
ncbi:MAG: hypothetical protein ACRC6O_13165 [Flavobacterium sp.]